MVERIGNDSSLVREAVFAAIRSQSQQSSAVRELASGISSQAAGLAPEGAATARATGGEGAPFAERLEEGLAAVDRDIRRVEELPADLLTGKLEDFHEVAVHIKKAEFTFRFAMEVRNKLIDAYREVMRMSV